MPTAVIAIMGEALDRELQARGIFSLGRKDCEAIMARVLETSAAVASKVSQELAAERK
jgi:hypothetical protein